ncbi:hypothetical protein F3Y22_tig00117034pilonHSYRG01624 [Hibiscus syriacus]|uniref:Histone acetyltransferase n=1 Tax=Hibiscus syriacus TaxID=106335 RepID=A0A6A2XFJ5_HIBSY|nr:hypothetical protein F3Y22_tig00117034pilonHSYRG01624 [Hibiscus syriacus]
MVAWEQWLNRRSGSEQWRRRGFSSAGETTELIRGMTQFLRDEDVRTSLGMITRFLRDEDDWLSGVTWVLCDEELSCSHPCCAMPYQGICVIAFYAIVAPSSYSSHLFRRLDEWVKLEQLDLDSVETVVDVKVEDKVTSLKMIRHQKCKINEIHVEVVHEELDDASLREHEEFTKVKNISTIELGRYEIETLYFSPFPPEYNDSLKLYFCEFCLNFMKHKEQLQRHMVSFASM